MKRWLMVALALSLASVAQAGQVHFLPLGAFVRAGVCAIDGVTSCASAADCSSGTCQLAAGCTKQRTIGTKFPVISMQCTATGIQEFFWEFVTPPDLPASVAAQVFFHTAATTGAVCFDATITIMDHNQSVPLLTTALDPTAATLTAGGSNPSISLPANQLYQYTQTLTPYRRSNDGDGSGDCSATNCRSRYAILRLARKNSGCAGNVASDVFIDGVGFTY